MMKRIWIFVLPFCIFACGKKIERENVNTNALKTQALPAVNYNWYYFSASSYHESPSFKAIPTVTKKPWTLSPFICDMASSGKAEYALINDVGVMEMKGEKVKLYTDDTLFSGRVAQNLEFYEGKPIFSLYKNEFFKGGKTPSSLDVFLLQFNSEAGVSVPIFSVENLGFSPDWQVTDFVWSEGEFLCSLKRVTQKPMTASDKDSSLERIHFSYISVLPKTPLTSISPLEASKNISVKKVTKEYFRAKKRERAFSESPSSLSSLLRNVDANFRVKVSYPEGGSSEIFVKRSTSSPALKAFASVKSTFTACLFEDGSFFMQGALTDSPLINGGRESAILLPRLSDGAIYTHFVVSGKFLYAAWEERDFQKISRSGFIRIDLSFLKFD